MNNYDEILVINILLQVLPVHKISNRQYTNITQLFKCISQRLFVVVQKIKDSKNQDRYW